MKLSMLKSFLLVTTLFVVTYTYAGNSSKSGQAGATELLINPWSRTSGWHGANSASIRGIEAMHSNVAGLAFSPRSEMIFSHTDWIRGWDVNIYSFGFSAKAGEYSSIGLSIMSMDLGDFIETTTDLPDGTGHTFNPQYLNVGLGYAKEFSKRIYGGVLVKLISESIPTVTATGVALDAGIQYVAGAKDQIKFGIALRNIGPDMSFSGDGLSRVGSFISASGENGYTQTLNSRSADFALPSLLNIGGSYDFIFQEIHRVTIAGNYVSNTYTKDQELFGVEYAYKTFLMLRAGYLYEKGLLNETVGNDFDNTNTNVFMGPSVGASVEIPFGKDNSGSFGLDYSVRYTGPFDNVHNIGVKIKI
ncbi:MAG: hypothetical protein A3H98_01775 [Bacteroidetes bacterium RIFCSPLOWO2_02_FULL_36_8]|nr:MAG: hypothetical protein A3H98_01775 [Bacteroidetes bacterium RIFCSPLOWO2_02_FULL_36_8]OFY69934.1 MAG: hypothetical protein A3G23_05615 [Bacteroidetes bacterium RIFCSPLOWO2_12_FULL_37_12]